MTADEQIEPLFRLDEEDGAALYRLGESKEGALRRFVLTTPETRTLLNEPERTGALFRQMLRQGIERGLALLPQAEEYRSLPDETINVLHFLRGGLNFALVEALAHIYHKNNQRASFVSSERARDKNGRWYIRDDQYLKLTLCPQTTLFVGDIVATGVTVAAGFAKIFEQTSGLPHDQLPPYVQEHLFSGLDEQTRSVLLGGDMRAPGPPIPLREIVFVTIGCPRLEEILSIYLRLFSQVFSKFQGITVLHLEGCFHLAQPDTPVPIKIPGTDLLRHPAAITPEFFLSQYDRLSNPLEGCVIYDGGSRSFHVEGHLREAIHYWSQLQQLAQEGLSLERALRQRWPEEGLHPNDADFDILARQRWPDAPLSLFAQIKEAFHRRWTNDFCQQAVMPQALLRLCQERMDSLENP